MKKLAILILIVMNNMVNASNNNFDIKRETDIPAKIFSDEKTNYCKHEYYKKVSVLYEYRNAETAKYLFQVLNCGGAISKASKQSQMVALVGGYMQENPNLIEPLYESAQLAGNTDSAKIFIDGLWFCSTHHCQEKLKKQPFQLPMNDVNILLEESPPDPLTVPICSPAMLDLLWGYMIGTGDMKIVDRVFDLINDNWNEINSSEPIGAKKRLLLSAARWSLVSIASQQIQVKKALKLKDNPVAKVLIAETE